MTDHINFHNRDRLVAIGRRLRTVRQGLGLTLNTAAEKAEIAPVVIGSWERADRRVTVDQLYRLADGYGVPISSFLPDEDAEIKPLPSEMVAAELRDLRETVASLESAIDALILRADA